MQRYAITASLDVWITVATRANNMQTHCIPQIIKLNHCYVIFAWSKLSNNYSPTLLPPPPIRWLQILKVTNQTY